ncbi:hypothetical protein A3F55_03080 [Candidatus Adlerbacteria bacterium RIFCSPHIGHO2_12_FULL_53_18]|uniref:TNase-like domain-containing protein n=1 Tax=Candidatus Adlerbacteria bacterium RIFCSPHIGHO2_12_FULL_53_18 TaxID=1797242 RepID=A0A1F4XTP7_9BACT|nr:MAG: hypothetical protein A3F55_03080 [Candidatus Adlerbacteria bacterium RIFCSPHIGHO2_12_FULL_53_18]
MLKHVIYGFFGLLAASVIALAIYVDKPSPSELPAFSEQNETTFVEDEFGQEASVAVAGSSSKLFKVSKVIDGDTISILKDGATETVRFIGVNAPETGQCYTAEATQKLKTLLASGSVSLELDTSQGERDKYDRLLAYVFTESGQNAARVLIEGGFAKEYTYSRAYKYQADFKAAQVSAQAGGKGLWAPGACAKPASAPTTPASAPAQMQTQPAPAAAAPVNTEAAKQQTPPKEEEPEEEPEEQDEEEEEPPPAPASSGSYTCSSNTYNCSDFSTHAEAQAVFDACGGVGNDVHKLDANKDGEACESLP